MYLFVSSSCTWYYNHYGLNGGADEQYYTLNDFILDTPYMRYPRGLTRGQEISKLYITNYNYFAINDGFLSILSRITKCNNNILNNNVGSTLVPPTTFIISLSEVQNYVLLCRDAMNFYTTKFARDYFNKFQEVVFKRLSNLTPLDYKELQQDNDKLLIEIILKDLEGILKYTLKDFPVAEIMGT